MASANPYLGREQTKAKHFILRTYLQALAFKVLNFSDLTFVDGFSGPWETREESFADSSFMIAIDVLKDAQRQLALRGIRKRIRCFFCERNRESYERLLSSVAPHNRPDEGFEIQTYGGQFTDAVPKISEFCRNSFALIFLDPTGWTGYGFDRIQPLLRPRLKEVMINYMYDFINRGVAMSDEATTASFDPILGGPGWTGRLDPTLSTQNRGMAVEKLFRETLKRAGQFDFVVSTKIYRATIDRPHFLLTYATKTKVGLSTFRDTEYKALKRQAIDRMAARERMREQVTGSTDMFAGMDAAIQTEKVDDFVRDEQAAARDDALSILQGGPRPFVELWPDVIQRRVLRVTNVKDICVALAREGQIENTWVGRRKPNDSDIIRLSSQYQRQIPR